MDFWIYSVHLEDFGLVFSKIKNTKKMNQGAAVEKSELKTRSGLVWRVDFWG